jgi:hypothetical protein
MTARSAQRKRHCARFRAGEPARENEQRMRNFAKNRGGCKHWPKRPARGLLGSLSKSKNFRERLRGGISISAAKS